MSALDTVLSRLPTPPRKAPARRGKTLRAFRATCPVCEGHGMPLDIAESAVSGMVLLHCHACQSSPGDILSALGLSMHDLLPERPTHHRARGNGGPPAWGSLMAAIDGLHQAHCRVLACAHGGDMEAGLQALLDAGQAMDTVKAMARNALREVRK